MFCSMRTPSLTEPKPRKFIPPPAFLVLSPKRIPDAPKPGAFDRKPEMG